MYDRSPAVEEQENPQAGQRKMKICVILRMCFINGKEMSQAQQETDLNQAEETAAESAAESEEIKIENKKKKPVREILLAAFLALIVFCFGLYGLQMAAGHIDWLPFGRSSPEKQAYQELKQEVSRLTSPEYISAGDGSGTYYQLRPDFILSRKLDSTSTAYSTILVAVRDYLSDQSEAEKLTKEDYAIEIPGKTVVAEFNCAIPFDDFIRYHRMKAPSGSRIHYVSRIIMSANHGGHLYFYDGKKDRYYRINVAGTKASVLTPEYVEGLLISASQNAERAAYAYDSIWYGDTELFPENVSGVEALEELSGNSSIPGSTTWTVPPTEEFTSEYTPTKKAGMKRLEKIFFPDGMDFIHKVKASDGSVIYMYGSMEKMLRLDRDGGFTYTQEAGSGGIFGWLNLKPAPDFFESLEIAVSYIREHGGWPAAENSNVGIRLVGAEEIDREGKVLASRQETGYRFTFDLDLLGFPLSYRDGTQITIDLYGASVASFHRDLPDLSQIRETERQSRGTTDPRERVYNTRKSTSGASRGNATSSKGKESASFTDGGTAISLKSVIRLNSTVLSEALQYEEGSQEEAMTESQKRKWTAEEITKQMTSAELQLIRFDAAEDDTDAEEEESSEETVSEDEIGDLSSQGIEDVNPEVDEDTPQKDWILEPVWKIGIGDHIFLFQARTGVLLYHT